MLVIRILKFTAVSVVLSAVLLFILAVLSYTTAISDAALSIFVYASVVLSVFVGALLCARAAGERVLLNALAQSALYYALLLALTFILNGSVTPSTHFAAMSAGIFASGVLGAITGGKGK